MSITDEIRNIPCGALFRRADLHIHSYGEFGSYDVTDINMTPENIIDLAIAEGLDVISITDHNSIGNVRSALNHSQGKNIFVIPGVELSTSQGHLLVYCQDIDYLEAFFGKLNISRDKKICNELITECLSIAREYEGIGIAAHIDTNAGFENSLSSYGPFKEEILKCQNLLGLEISMVDNENWYTERDSNPDRKRLFRLRRSTISEDTNYEIAKVLFSDAHTLNSLGKNITGNKKITRIKMDQISFDAFRIALTDASARVRIEDLIPYNIPKFTGLKIEGGFLSGQLIHFSNNLTCIIGGRGAGKSSVIEAVRAVSGNKARENLLDCEIWPDRIYLVYEDETGRVQELYRDKLGTVINVTDSENGITYVPIESYGQGETAETIQHCDKNPYVLLSFLDGFAEFGALKNDDEELRRKLIDNQQEIERLTLEVNSIPDINKAYKNAEAQLEVLKLQKAGDIVKLEASLSKERNYRVQLIKKLNSLIKTIRENISDNTIKELAEELDSSQILTGKTELESIKSVLENYSNYIKTISTTIGDETNRIIGEIKIQLKQWEAQEKDTQSKIESIRKSLEEKGIKLDMAFIRKTTSDVTHYSQRLKGLRKMELQLKELWKSRREISKERRDLRSKIYAIRNGLATRLNNNLSATVIDYSVTVKFREGLLSSEIQEIIKDALEWRTSQVPRAELISRQISVFDLLNAIHSKNHAVIENVEDIKKNKIFSKTDAQLILQKLDNLSVIFRLERCEFEDRPEIYVTKSEELPNGSYKHVTKDFARLSLGQQQSILLSILLYSKSTQPLIIDQPEDNLDSEFIYKTLVMNLRRVKEHRQVIIVTHNANIAVLGDAELIIPLRSTSDRAMIVARGSIDAPNTKDMTCKILEGSDQAFIKRKNIYGI